MIQYFSSIISSNQQQIELPIQTDLLYAYSIDQVVTGYTGATIRIYRADATEQDFNVGVTWSEINTFLGGQVGKLKTIYDQKEVANLTQTNTSLMAEAIEGANGKPAFRFGNRDGSVDSIYQATVSIDSDNICISNVGSSLVTNFFGTAGSDLLTYQGGIPPKITVAQTSQFRGSTLYKFSGDSSMQIVGYNSRSDLVRSFVLDYHTEDFTKLPTVAHTDYRIGKRSNDQFDYLGIWQESLIYSSLSDSNQVLVNENQKTRFSISTKSKYIICDGDSLTFGYRDDNPVNPPIELSYPYNLSKLFSQSAVIQNYGISGEKIADLPLQSNWSSRYNVLDDCELTPYYIIWIGTNDIEHTDLATMQSGYQALISDILTNAPNTILVHITLYKFQGFTQLTKWADFNSWILSTYSGNLIVDLSLDAVFGSESPWLETDYIGPTSSHLTELGNQRIATLVYNKITGSSLTLP